jgi:hypothetical protein
MPTGKINTWSVKLRDSPDGNELPGYVALGQQVDVKIDDGSGWLLVVAEIDGERRLGFVDGCYALLEANALVASPPVAPEGGIGVDAIHAAQSAKQKSGVPASALLAEWALASSFGRLTPSGANNPFRVAPDDGQESVEVRIPQDVGSWRTYALARLRKYASLAEAMDDHARTIAENPTYANARLALPDPLRFLDALADVGGKGPGYGSSLRQLMRTYDLTRFD